MAKGSRTIRVRRYKLWEKMATSFSNLSEMKAMQWYLVLANGEEITIPKTGFEIFAFEKPEGEYHYHVFKSLKARNTS